MTFEIEQVLAKLSETKTSAKMLTLTKWNGNPAKLDIRLWRTDIEPIQPCKGMTLSNSEAEALADAINNYL